MADKEERRGKQMNFEFGTTEEKQAFFDKCGQSGRTATKIIKLLIAGYMEGKFKIK